nr:MAG TPA: hypothetical protein [Caudoviricetes sp.]
MYIFKTIFRSHNLESFNLTHISHLKQNSPVGERINNDMFTFYDLGVYILTTGHKKRDTTEMANGHVPYESYIFIVLR